MERDEFLQVKGLCKSFHKLDVLKDITTSFARNEVVSIIGPSGGGKSTFLRCLNLLETPTSGSILFDGVNICDKKQNINLHRQKMGMVFQQFNLFNNANVLHNLIDAPSRSCPRRRWRKKPWIFSVGWAWMTVRTAIPISSPAGRSSGSPSSVR